MVQTCCLCRSTYNTSLRISLHKFPCQYLERDNLLKWVKACRISLEGIEKKRICSRHFRKEDYVCSLRRLKPDAVPSVNIPRPDIQHPSDEIITGDLDQFITPDDPRTHDFAGIEEKDPLQIDENESLSIPEAGVTQDECEVIIPCKSEELETSSILVDATSQDKVLEEDTSQIDELETPLIPETNIIQEEGEHKTPAPFSEARVRVDLRITTAKLHKLRQEMRVATESLRRKTKEVKTLRSSHNSLLVTITVLRKRVVELEQQITQSLREGRILPQNIESNSCDSAYNLVKAERDLLGLGEKGMPRFWSFTTTSAGILLLYANNLGNSSWPVSRCITVQPDMSLDIQMVTSAPKINLGPMTCLMDILCAMKTVASIRPCPGFNGKCSSKGFLEPGAHPASETCATCQKEYAARLKPEKSAPVNVSPAKKKSSEMSNLRSKLRRVEKNLDLAEDEIIKLKHENIRLKKLRNEAEKPTTSKDMDLTE